MNGRETLSKAKKKDLIAIDGQDGMVHLVFEDRKTENLRICRPRMLDGTGSRVEKEWTLVGHCESCRDYESVVKSMSRKVCRHCAKFAS